MIDEIRKFCSDCKEYDEQGCVYWITYNPYENEDMTPRRCIHYNYRGEIEPLKGINHQEDYTYCLFCSHCIEKVTSCKCCGVAWEEQKFDDDEDDWKDDEDEMDDEEDEDEYKQNKNSYNLRSHRLKDTIRIYKMVVNCQPMLYATLGKTQDELWDEIYQKKEHSTPTIYLSIPDGYTPYDILKELCEDFKKEYPSLREKSFVFNFNVV
jgi:hypothetical protein